jgi:hypothetical protein
MSNTGYQLESLKAQNRGDIKDVQWLSVSQLNQIHKLLNYAGLTVDLDKDILEQNTIEMNLDGVKGIV